MGQGMSKGVGGGGSLIHNARLKGIRVHFKRGRSLTDARVACRRNRVPLRSDCARDTPWRRRTVKTLSKGFQPLRLRRTSGLGGPALRLTLVCVQTPSASRGGVV